MSSLTNDIYYAQISCPKRKRTILAGFIYPTLEKIFDVAAKIGITGQYLISAKDNTIIGDKLALRYMLERNHMVLVCDSLVCCHSGKVCLEVSGETTTDEQHSLPFGMVQSLELEFTDSEMELLKELLQGVANQTVITFRKFLSGQTHSKA